ncbi:MAG: ATP-binding cassette domain-containing protein [Chloroflexi bacterium]|nr:ATP-binding cassette domain-containing protein [Chloroflexota bacterium]
MLKALSVNATTTCKAQDIWFAYRQSNWVLKGVTIDVPSEGFLTILGPSGSGKTTLLKILAGMLKPQSGNVELFGTRLVNGTANHPEFRQRVGYIPQQLGLVRGMTALENVLLGALGRIAGALPLLGVFPKAEVERARGYLDLLAIGDKAREKVYRLSGGERQRVAIARTLLQDPKIIFADEFVSDLDLPRAAQILAAMRDLTQREKIAFVVNMHEIPLVQDLGDEVMILKKGIIVHRGAARDLSMSLAQEILE